MALTSSSFMTGPGGYSATLSNKLDKIDCSQVLAAVLIADKEILGHIKMGPPARNIEINWIEDELNPAYVMCSSSANNRVTFSSGYTAASLKRFIRNKTILQPANMASVAMQVTTSVTSTGPAIATVAAYSSTTWASWTVTKCYIVASPYSDISSASDDASQTRTKRKNFTQVFEKAVQITKTRQGMDMEAVVSELQLQIKYRTLEIKRELAMSILRGMVYRSSGASGDTEYRSMAGIIQLIRDYDLDATNEDETVINASSSALTVARLNSLCYKVWDKGGLDETSDPILIMAANQARVFASFDKEYRRDAGPGERKVGYYKNLFLSDMNVELPVVMDRWCPKDVVILLDRSRISLRALQGDAWHMEKMAKTGRNEKWQLSGQYTIEMQNPNKCHGMIRGLTG